MSTPEAVVCDTETCFDQLRAPFPRPGFCFCTISRPHVMCSQSQATPGKFQEEENQLGPQNKIKDRFSEKISKLKIVVANLSTMTGLGGPIDDLAVAQQKPVAIGECSHVM